MCVNCTCSRYMYQCPNLFLMHLQSPPPEVSCLGQCASQLQRVEKPSAKCATSKTDTASGIWRKMFNDTYGKNNWSKLLKNIYIQSNFYSTFWWLPVLLPISIVQQTLSKHSVFSLSNTTTYSFYLFQH